MDPLTVPKFPFWNVISPREKVSILLIARMETLAIVCNIVFSIECKSYLTIFNLSSFYSPLNNWPIEIFILEIEFTIRFDSSFFSFFEWIDDIVDTCDYPYSVILYSTANIFFFFYVYTNLWTSIATYLDSPLVVLSGLIIHILGRGLLVELVQHGRYKFAVNCIEVEEIMAERMIDSKAMHSQFRVG